MVQAFTVGTATAKAGTIQYGRWEALHHPTGHTEFFPVIIAQGREAGPCLWLTAGIHGPEHGGPTVLYRLITQELVERMRGTIVAIPALNPAGLRTMSREPYHARTDPNRLWPDGKPRHEDPDKRPPTSLEQAYSRLFATITEVANYLIDYHNAQTGSLSFVIRDRVLYRADHNAAANKARAEALLAQQEGMIQAYGHTVINEFPIDKYIDEKLHRSTSAAAAFVGGIPSLTVELGTGLVPDPSITLAAVAGTRNIMRWAGMLAGNMEPIQGIPVVDPGFATRRCSTPRVTEAGVVLHLVKPGDVLRQGDPVAEIRDVWGRPIGQGIIQSEYDGFVFGRSHGIYYYPGDHILGMAIRDEQPLLAPYPADFFNKYNGE